MALGSTTDDFGPYTGTITGTTTDQTSPWQRNQTGPAAELERIFKEYTARTAADTLPPNMYGAMSSAAATDKDLIASLLEVVFNWKARGKFKVLEHGNSKTVVYTGDDELTTFKLGKGFSPSNVVEFVSWLAMIPKPKDEK